MKRKKTLSFILIICLVCALFSPAALAADVPSPGDLLERFGPLLGDGLDALTDWLDGQAEELAPELRKTLRDIDTGSLFSDFKDLLGDTAELTDEELRAKIVELAEKNGTHLVDDQVRQLMDLCRALEKLNGTELRERGEALKEELTAPGGLRGAWQSIVDAFKSAGNWISEKLGGLFG